MRLRRLLSPDAAAYFTIIVLFLLLFTLSPSLPSPRRYRNRRLKLHLAGPHSTPHLASIDPLVNEIERRLEERGWLGFEDEEDYINDEARFNITHRLEIVFEMMDDAPADGFVDGDELTKWINVLTMNKLMRWSKREMGEIDKNKDGFISFDEFKPSPWARHSRNISSDVGWWKKDHFDASDANGDGLLNITEFDDFLHPEDSKNPKLLRWLCKEEIREKDADKDGKLNFEEFDREIFDLIEDYEFCFNFSQSSDSRKAKANQLFSCLDLDNNRFLTEEEFIPVIGKIYPSELDSAKRLVHSVLLPQADKNKDGRLTLQEMMEDPYTFYSAISDEEEDDYYHSEF